MRKHNVGIAGIGLIGGSLALDLAADGHGVVAYDRDARACAAAMDLGLALQADTDIAVLDDCSVIVVAVPVLAMSEVLDAIAGLDAPNLELVFDTGSTKLAPLAHVNGRLGGRLPFVACHPIAGNERSGVRAATRELFRNRNVVVCDADPQAPSTRLARELWESCGASVSAMSAADHDRLFACVSHLPHMLAYLLIGMLGSHPQRDLLLEHAASGFADFTRIASSDPQMWRDVCLTNGDNIVAVLDEYAAELKQLRDAIAANDGERLHDYFARSRTLRDNWLAARRS